MDTNELLFAIAIAVVLGGILAYVLWLQRKQAKKGVPNVKPESVLATTPLKLQAYERLILLADRIALPVAGDPFEAREKVLHLVDELGFDAAVDYKAGTVRAQLAELTPTGIDVSPSDSPGGTRTVTIHFKRGRGVAQSGSG
jgi:uncharacterized iron-regulated membrane protein